jgi:FlaA1/EpsC-like NDP-sugar epimerase
MRTRFRSFLLSQPRAIKLTLLAGMDALLIPISLWMAVSVRNPVFFAEYPDARWAFGVLTLSTIPIFGKLGLYRIVTRYMNLQALFIIELGALISAAILWGIMMATSWLPAAVAIVVSYGLVLMLLVAGSRILLRNLLTAKDHSSRIKVAIYGAGDSGCQLLQSLRQGTQYNVAAFLDDDPSLHFRMVQGVQVISPAAEGWQDQLIAMGVQEVFLCIPEASRTEKRKIMGLIEPTSLTVKTIPSVDQLVSGQAQLDELRKIEIEDLLGRDPVSPTKHLLEQCIRDKCVLVTGAAGSIGSELCRQILLLGSRRLILLDHSEYGLFQIENNLIEQAAQSGRKNSIVALLGSVSDKARLESIFETYSIDTVYHAAAYKHVPMVEHNSAEGIKVNVMGTWNVADCARRFGVSRFILISTDKAVRPTNVMGATKRLAEMILQAMDKDASTVFSMVRFGNVLGSSGSVVPRFREQIQAGGPVTVTHPEITRFFMTIPEAVQLVIQAGSMGQGGDVFVLDMGEPVKIADMARDMVRLSGRDVRDENNPDGDIEIIYTGLRPGEKLYEELLIGGNVLGTEHPKIMRAVEVMLPISILESRLHAIDAAIKAADVELLRSLLVECVEGYQPNESVADHVWRENLENQLVTKRHTLHH